MCLLRIWKTACKRQLQRWDCGYTLGHGKHPLLLLMALGGRDWTAHSPFGSAWTIPVPNQCRNLHLHLSSPTLFSCTFLALQSPSYRARGRLCLEEIVPLWMCSWKVFSFDFHNTKCLVWSSSLSSWQLGLLWYAQPNMVTFHQLFEQNHCVALAT